MKFQILFLLFAICSMLRAAETNDLYLTDDGKSIDGWSLHPEKNPKLVQAAIMTNESLPAEEFPEGHWGSVQDGFQLSLRFDKQSYTNGEPICAILLLRNVTNRVLRYGVGPDYVDCPVGFSVTSTDGKQIPLLEKFFSGGSAWQVFLPPKTQHRYTGLLKERYELTNGIYSVCALKVVGLNHETVKSSGVEIKVENIPKK